KAHAARRGSTDPIARLEARARTRMERVLHVQDYERTFGDSLVLRGYVLIPQYAIGPYNVDLADDVGRVAVEFMGRQLSKKRVATYAQRLEYILDRGWFVLLVNLEWRALGMDVAAICDQVIALMERGRSDHSLVGKYGMIGRHGEPLTKPRRYFPNRPSIFASHSANK